MLDGCFVLDRSEMLQRGKRETSTCPQRNLLWYTLWKDVAFAALLSLTGVISVLNMVELCYVLVLWILKRG